ncbi:MAG: S8 family peptidase [Pirellulaceae bacterium]|nr:S8 family peptidase [Pirellulaceae bacterium]
MKRVLSFLFPALWLVLLSSHVPMLAQDRSNLKIDEEKVEGGGGPPAMVDVLVGFANAPGPNEHAIIRGQGGVVKTTYSLVPAIAARIPQVAVDALKANPNVTVVEPDGIAFAIGHSGPVVDEGLVELQNGWGVDRIGAGWVHRGYEIIGGSPVDLPLLPNTGTNIGVAVLDTGLDYTHPEFAHNYRGGYDYINNDSDPFDDHFHGTHVAGTIAADWNNVGVVGVAPDVDLYVLKVLGANGGGSWSGMISALDWCVKHNADVRAGLKPGHSLIRVTNHSYGGTSLSTLYEAALRNSYARGMVHIAASGNSGRADGIGDNIVYPARFPSVVAVAATNSSDIRAGFSSTGPALELSAPGVLIRSAWPLWRTDSELGFIPGYRQLSGTSMAAPHAAGVAALLLSAKPDLTSSGTRALLRATADPLGNLDHYGYGLVDSISGAMAAEAAAPGFPIRATIAYSQLNGKKDLVVTITVRETQSGNPVPGAYVDGVLMRKPWQQKFSGVADNQGRFIVTVAWAQKGTYTTVLDAIADARISWPGGAWDGQTPNNSFKH